ncbi:hypothetical protein CFE70_008759 [Pyrenophora teres f. teres 0-1]
MDQNANANTNSKASSKVAEASSQPLSKTTTAAYPVIADSLTASPKLLFYTVTTNICQILLYTLEWNVISNMEIYNIHVESYRNPKVGNGYLFFIES